MVLSSLQPLTKGWGWLGDGLPGWSGTPITALEGGIDIIEAPAAEARVVERLAETMTQAILTAPKGYLTTSEVRAAAGGARDRQSSALSLVGTDPRIASEVEKVQTRDGKLRDAQVWRPARKGLF